MSSLRIIRDGDRFRIFYAKSTPVHQVGGKTVSSRGKTNDPACSSAASAWRRGTANKETYTVLAHCRAIAATKHAAKLHSIAGNAGHAQHLEHIAASTHVTKKDRASRAAELRGQHNAELMDPNSDRNNRAFDAGVARQHSATQAKRAATKAVVQERADESGQSYADAKKGFYTKPSVIAAQRTAATAGAGQQGAEAPAAAPAPAQAQPAASPAPAPTPTPSPRPSIADRKARVLGKLESTRTAANEGGEGTPERRQAFRNAGRDVVASGAAKAAEAGSGGYFSKLKAIREKQQAAAGGQGASASPTPAPAAPSAPAAAQAPGRNTPERQARLKAILDAKRQVEDRGKFKTPTGETFKVGNAESGYHTEHYTPESVRSRASRGFGEDLDAAQHATVRAAFRKGGTKIIGKEQAAAEKESEAKFARSAATSRSLAESAAKPATPTGRRHANAADLAADYKARGVEPTAAYSQFVRDRDLQPEMDAKEFAKVYGTVTPKRYAENVSPAAAGQPKAPARAPEKAATPTPAPVASPASPNPAQSAPTPAAPKVTAADHRRATVDAALEAIKSGKAEAAPHEAMMEHRRLKAEHRAASDRIAEINRRLHSAGPSMSERGRLKNELTAAKRAETAAGRAKENHEFKVAQGILKASGVAGPEAPKRDMSQSRRAPGGGLRLTDKPPPAPGGGLRLTDKPPPAPGKMQALLNKERWSPEDVAYAEKHMDSPVVPEATRNKLKEAVSGYRGVERTVKEDRLKPALKRAGGDKKYAIQRQEAAESVRRDRKEGRTYEPGGPPSPEKNAARNAKSHVKEVLSGEFGRRQAGIKVEQDRNREVNAKERETSRLASIQDRRAAIRSGKELDFAGEPTGGTKPLEQTVSERKAELAQKRAESSQGGKPGVAPSNPASRVAGIKARQAGFAHAHARGVVHAGVEERKDYDERYRRGSDVPIGSRGNQSIKERVKRPETAKRLSEIRARFHATPKAQAVIAEQGARADQRGRAKLPLFGGQTPDERPHEGTPQSAPATPRTSPVPGLPKQPHEMTNHELQHHHDSNPEFAKAWDSRYAGSPVNPLYHSLYLQEAQHHGAKVPEHLLPGGGKAPGGAAPEAQPPAPATPARPSLKEQVAAKRATKGTPQERTAALQDRIARARGSNAEAHGYIRSNDKSIPPDYVAKVRQRGAALYNRQQRVDELAEKQPKPPAATAAPAEKAPTPKASGRNTPERQAKAKEIRDSPTYKAGRTVDKYRASVSGRYGKAYYQDKKGVAPGVYESRKEATQAIARAHQREDEYKAKRAAEAAAAKHKSQVKGMVGLHTGKSSLTPQTRYQMHAREATKQNALGFKQKEIHLSTGEEGGKRTPVKAHVLGDLAAHQHPGRTPGKYDDQAFGVTHIPSGLSVGSTHSLARAKQIAGAIHARKIDLAHVSETRKSPESKKHLKYIHSLFKDQG